MSDHIPDPSAHQKPKLLDLVRASIRTKHYSSRTEESYVSWVKRYVLFHLPNEIKLHRILLIHSLSYLAMEADYPGIAISHRASKRHPKDMGEKEINQYITHLAVKEKVSASTQNQALCAFVFLYKHLLNKEFGWQFVFPAANISNDPKTGVRRRHHVSEWFAARIKRCQTKNRNIKTCQFSHF